jgi:hypothetical protein
LSRRTPKRRLAKAYDGRVAKVRESNFRGVHLREPRLVKRL